MIEIRVFLIPTNRDVEMSLKSASMEIGLHKEEYYILVVDNSKEEIRNKNIRAVRLYNSLGFKVLFCGLQKQRKFLEMVADDCGIDKEILFEFFIVDNCDYGKIFNISYLLITALGADIFHRRDSDCYVFEPDDKKSYPIFMESKYLGKQIENTDLNIYAPDIYNKKDLIYIVGSDYSGNWNLDLNELEEEQHGTLKKLFNLSNIPANDFKYYINTKYLKCDIQIYNRAKFEYEDDLYQWPEMGNISMYEIFKWMPNFMGEGAIGFDYHTYNMSFLFGMPSLYHPNKIPHIYDGGRKSIEKLKTYWKGIVKLNDYNLVMNKFSKMYFQKDSNKMGFQALQEGVLEGRIEKLFRKIINERDILQRKHILRVVEDILLSSKKDKYIKIGKWLSMLGDEILKEIDSDYERSLDVQKIWRTLIQACEINSDKYSSFLLKDLYDEVS